MRITLDDSNSIAALTVTNRDQREVVMQAAVKDWSIRDNDERYQGTDELIVTPPVFSVAPGASQIVRVGLRDTRPSGTEQAFRVFLEQAPATPGGNDRSEGDSAAQSPQGVQVMLRLGIPVFVEPAGSARRELAWRVERLADGRMRVAATNRGNVHAKVMRVALLGGDDAPLAESDESRYILPDSRRHWLLDPPADTAAPYTIKAWTRDGELHETVPANSR